MIIRYTPEAIEGLVRLREFIEKKNPQAAARVAYSLTTGIGKLKDFPFIGVEVSKAPNPKIVRDLVIENYLVRYLVIDDAIHILRLWHQKENRVDV
ncbi:MAG: type II toxin-antitoxin system RelE/ParE family toxin [Pseudomonadales bacterium]|nr:type II toxin-antitoxin system RelE/ParE family toxin [Pseudomonadales bacterium]